MLVFFVGYRGMPLREQDSPCKYRDTCTACVGKVFKIITESTFHSPTSEAVGHRGGLDQ